MATVRGMTPEAIRALLKKELGDYQALSIAVNSAKGASESAVAEVEKLRNNIDNMDFDIDMSEYNEAMEKFETDMTELNQNLDELKEEALSRENKLTALDAALKQDRSKFNREMQKMAKELSDSKEKLQQDLSDAADKLAQNVVDVGDRLSGELDNANKTLSESLAKDLKKLDTDLSEAFGKDLKALETSQNAKTNALDKELKNYKKNTDSKVSNLLSDIEKAKAYADGFMKPGNLVWNPEAKDNARDIRASNNSAKVESVHDTGPASDGGLKITKTKSGGCYVQYGDPRRHGFELKKGYTFKYSAWVKTSVDLPIGAFYIKSYDAGGVRNVKILPNTWVKLEGEGSYTRDEDKYTVFEVYVTGKFPVNATLIVANPQVTQKVTSDLIVDGAVMSKSLATGAVTAGKIATDAITANNIVAGSIGARQIAAKSIGADQLAANAVTAEKIVGKSIDASKIKAKSIGADQLAANAVTTEKLDANAVTAAKINAGAVTAQKIASKAINGDHIQANSIDTTKLTIMPGNLFPDPRFLDPVWNIGGNRTTSKYFGYENGYRIKALGAQTGLYYQPAGIPDDTAMSLEPGAAYRLTCRINFEGATQPDRLDCYLRFVDKTKNAKSLQLIGGIKRTSSNTKVNNSYGMGELDFVYPDRAKDSLCTIGFFLQSSHKAGQVTITDVAIVRAADASLIVKGGVQADHIASNAITTRHMSANSIEGDRIKSDSIDARKIIASTLTSDRVIFKEGFIKRAMIGSGQIDDAKIANLNAAKITAGEMHGSRISAGTMHGDRIIAGTLDANRIKANTLSADQIAAGTLNADRIGTRSITASKIATKTIGADQLAADAITSDKIKANAIQGEHIAADTITVNQLRAGTIVPIGGSLIHSEPKISGGVPEPIWWEVCDTELAANYRGFPRPEGNPWRMCSQAQGKSLDMAPPKRLVKIKPGQKYRLTFWCRGTKANTRLYIEMRDQKGSHAVKSGAVYGTVNSGNYKTAAQAKEAWPVTDFSESNAGSYLVSNFTLPTSITKVTSTIEFKDDVEYVYLGKFFFNHRSSSAQGNQWLSGLSLELEIPDQQAIDARQDRMALYLKKMVENMSRMMARIEAYKPDFTTIPKRFTGVVSHKGVGIITDTRDRIHIFMDPTWTGVVRIQAFYSMPKQPTSVVFFDLDESDFTLHSTATCPQDPPPNFPYRNGSFKYTSVMSKYDDSPNSYGLTSATMFITYDMSYKEMFELLSSQVVPLTGSLTYGRNVPPPPLSDSKEEGVPWDHMGTIRR